ncbi:hypothetical protein DMA11_15830 [Marinilabiliaceae bacterium JC017]|nr:hypothetical protein DMA11_19830 [Marinilabiliaceae bacterium JC017]TAJ11661.1 hypothetical protein DMA11_15830 [Marinilabiliaceae bacterium JC017]
MAVAHIDDCTTRSYRYLQIRKDRDDSHYLEKYTLECLKNKLIHLEQATSKTKVLIPGNETLCKLVI